MENDYQKFLYQSDPSYNINPFHFEVQAPCPYDESKHYVVFIHSEALWKWKTGREDPFDVFLYAMRQFGYDLTESSRKRISQLLKMRIHQLKAELVKIRNKAYQEKLLQRWIEITVYRTEILCKPLDTFQAIHQELKLSREKVDSISSLLFR